MPELNKSTNDTPTPPAAQARDLALVTGASSGIGFELAKVCARNGYDVLINSEDGQLDAAAEAIRELGVEAYPFQADLATLDGVRSLARAVEETGRPVKLLALNAGIGVGGDFLETSLEQELRLIATNCAATVHLAKLVLPRMIAYGGGYVLITASIAAIMPSPYEAVYGASKAFTKVFAESLRAELEDRNVKVTALMPGPTETNFFHRAGMDDTSAGTSKKDDPAVVAQQGFDALMKGKDHVIAGSLKTKAMGVASEVLPEVAKAKLHKGMSKPGSGKGKPPTQLGKSGNPESAAPASRSARRTNPKT